MCCLTYVGVCLVCDVRNVLFVVCCLKCVLLCVVCCVLFVVDCLVWIVWCVVC